MEKKIIITIKPDGLIDVPNHLKKPDIITFEIDKNLQPLETIKILGNLQAQLINQFDAMMTEAMKKIKSNGIN